MSLIDKVTHTANSLLSALKMPDAASQTNQVLGDMRFPQLSSLLPYRDYDESSGLFINDGSIGFMLEVQPLTGASPTEVMAIESLLRTKLPRGVPFSIHLMSSKRVGDYIESGLRDFSWSGREAEKFNAITRAYYLTAAEDRFSLPPGIDIPLTLRNRLRGAFTAPFSGKLNTGSLYIEMQHELHSYGVPLAFMLLGSNVRYGRNDWGSRPLNVGGVTLTEGQQVDIFISMDSGGNLGAFLDALLRQLNGGGGGFPLTLYVTLDGSTAVQFWVPTTSVPADCALAQEAGAVKVNTQCSEPGGERPVVVNGQTYTVSASCWRFTDTYRLQEASQGSCDAYANNSACTVATHACAFNDEQGACLRENVTYSCETRTTGNVMMCGGQVYCLDGECDKQQKGTQGNDFGHAVSVLAAVAAAGKDVAALNGVDVRAFTGKGQSCRKAFAGFSDCCKDSGWGNNVGLANCDSEEKALGKAKENKLTVSVGEYCSKKVLGVCLQKKRSYCQFDSKLAQIVQQQGRAWQLGIGFGGAKSPDCRGITVDELQRINFDRLDFANFYEDLMKNQKVPEDAALVEKVKQQITQRMQEAQK